MHRSLPGPVDYLLLATLALLWGVAFPLAKVSVVDYPPITLTLCRQLIATITLALLAWMYGRRWFFPSRGDAFAMLACALFGSVLPFTLINWSVEKIDSGMAAILMGFMPLATLIIAHFATKDEKMTTPKLAGVILGIFGLAVLFWPSLRSGLGSNIVREVSLLGAAVSYAVNALFLKRLVGHPSLVLMTYIGALTVGLLAPFSFALDAPLSLHPGAVATLSMIVLGILSYTVGALVMFAIVSRQGVVFFGQINLLVPVVGVALGMIMLGERPGLNAIVALAIIFSGLVVARINPNRAVIQESRP